MVSLHTSPLATPGVGDAGGLNVYVAELATALGRQGVEVEIMTRRADPETPEVVPLAEGVTVRQVTAGPPEPVRKEQLPGLVGEFADHLRPLIGGFDVIHSHYWLSGLAALELEERPPLVHTMHTMARVKNAALAEDQRAEPEPRADGESMIVKSAEGLTANTPDEAADLRRLYGAESERITIVPPGVDLDVFHPCDQLESRTKLGVPMDAELILFVGRIQPLKAPDVLIGAAAELIKERPSRRDRLRLIIIGSPSGPDRDWADTLPDAGGFLAGGRSGRVPAALGTARVVSLVLRQRPRRRTVAQRVVRPGRPRGAGLHPARRRRRCRRTAARGGRRPDRHPRRRT